MVVRGNETIIEGKNSLSQLAIKIISISGHQISPGGACYERSAQHFPQSYLLQTKPVATDFENILWFSPGTPLCCTAIGQAPLC